jgi:hypothetical protein
VAVGVALDTAVGLRGFPEQKESERCIAPRVS